MTDALNHRQHAAPTRRLSPVCVILLVVGVITP
jgi:hypothetical protein